jgi:hypothetical protein
VAAGVSRVASGDIADLFALGRKNTAPPTSNAIIAIAEATVTSLDFLMTASEVIVNDLDPLNAPASKPLGKPMASRRHDCAIKVTVVDVCLDAAAIERVAALCKFHKTITIVRHRSTSPVSYRQLNIIPKMQCHNRSLCSP